MTLFTPLRLASGVIINNRIAKAAMEENMADADHAPSTELLTLYQARAQGGAGVIITGNVMVDARAMTGPAGVVLDDDRHLDKFRAWSQAARANGAQVWMQINHLGGRCPRAGTRDAGPFGAGAGSWLAVFTLSPAAGNG